MTLKSIFLHLMEMMDASQIFVGETCCSKWIKNFCHNDSRCLKVFS